METTLPPNLNRPHLQTEGIWHSIRAAVEIGLMVLILYTLVNLVTARFVVDGSSMYPQFETGQYVIVSRLNYLFGEPQRGDIVVFHYPYSPDEDYIKRLIGLPGDVVEIRETWVYVNGERLDEPYIAEACSENSCGDGRWQVGENQYFLMGDNRNNSSDSRRFGVVDRSFIVGEAVLRYLPPEDFGLVLHLGYPG